MNDILPYSEQFQKIVEIIDSARERAYRRVNEELILMYRDIGEYISKQSEVAEYGDAFVQKLADFFSENYPDLKGFNRRGLYRMKQFYELYKDEEKVSTLLTQLSWSNHLKIMSACRTMDERIFYMNMCIKEKYSARELARQIDSGYYERYIYPKNRCLLQSNNLKRQPAMFFWIVMYLIFLMFPKRFQNTISKNLSFAI